MVDDESYSLDPFLYTIWIRNIVDINVLIFDCLQLIINIPFAVDIFDV